MIEVSELIGLMRLSALPVSSMAALVLVVLVLVLNVAVLCNGGITSITHIRKVTKTDDMPLDSDVFRVPPGYNAPQQVYFGFTYVVLCLRSTNESFFSIYN